jgi:hypothetical protein
MIDQKDDALTIPQYTLDSINRWVCKGIYPGGFLCAVLTNDLMGAVGRADQTNIAVLVDIVRYVYNWIPGECWGSKEKMAAWSAQKQRE